MNSATPLMNGLKASLMFLYGGTDHELCHTRLNGLKASLMFLYGGTDHELCHTRLNGLKASRLETVFQTSRFGEVEWAHCIEENDTTERLAAGAIFTRQCLQYSSA
jgi:hypothetical protein